MRLCLKHFLLNISQNDVCLSKRGEYAVFLRTQSHLLSSGSRCHSAAVSCSGAHNVSMADALCSGKAASVFEKEWGEGALNTKNSKHSRLTWQNIIPSNQLSLQPCKSRRTNTEVCAHKICFLTSLSFLLIHFNTTAYHSVNLVFPHLQIKQRERRNTFF